MLNSLTVLLVLGDSGRHVQITTSFSKRGYVIRRGGGGGLDTGWGGFWTGIGMCRKKWEYRMINMFHMFCSPSEFVSGQFGRYSFLTLGVLYGAYHQRRLSAKEVKVREIEAKHKEVRDAKLAIEKARTREGKIIDYFLRLFQLKHFFTFPSNANRGDRCHQCPVPQVERVRAMSLEISGFSVFLSHSQSPLSWFRVYFSTQFFLPFHQESFPSIHLRRVVFPPTSWTHYPPNLLC